MQDEYGNDSSSQRFEPTWETPSKAGSWRYDDTSVNKM